MKCFLNKRQCGRHAALTYKRNTNEIDTLSYIRKAFFTFIYVYSEICKTCTVFVAHLTKWRNLILCNHTTYNCETIETFLLQISKQFQL